MSVSTLLIYIIASIILNIILNKLETKRKENLIDYIVISNIYMIILSGIFTTYGLTSNNDNIFLIIFFLILGKIFYITIIKERTILSNSFNLRKYLLTLVSSYLINILIINKVNNIFPSMENIKLILWLFIIEYVFLYLKKNVDIKIPTNNNISFSQDREYIVMQYAKYKNKYFNLVNSKYSEINLLIYSIMIYENYNKPELIRKIDILKHNFFSEENKFGIMQIKRKTPITDETSIEIAKKKLERLYITNNKEISNINRKMNPKKLSSKELIKKYYKKEMKEVESIYLIIKDFNIIK